MKHNKLADFIYIWFLSFGGFIILIPVMSRLFVQTNVAELPIIPLLVQGTIITGVYSLIGSILSERIGFNPTYISYLINKRPLWTIVKKQLYYSSVIGFLGAVILFLTSNSFSLYIGQFPILNRIFGAGLYEEIMVRGYMLNNFMSSMNKYFALIVTSFCFMIIHLMNANISIIGMINLFLAGLLLGIFYIHKTNLWFPIGMHLTWNFFQGPVFGYEVSGFHTQSIITQEIKGNPIITGGEFGFEGSILATVISIIMIVVIHRMEKQA